MELMTCRPKMRYAPTKSNFLLLAFANFEAGVFPLDGHFEMTDSEAKEFFSYPEGEFFKGVVSQERPENGSATRALTTQVMREVVLPAITKEVNEGANFAPLRQIYHTLIHQNPQTIFP